MPKLSPIFSIIYTIKLVRTKPPFQNNKQGVPCLVNSLKKIELIVVT